MVDIPENLENHAEVFIYGVEGEQIEEENDAYNDLRYELGKISPQRMLRRKSIFDQASTETQKMTLLS